MIFDVVGWCYESQEKTVYPEFIALLLYVAVGLNKLN